MYSEQAIKPCPLCGGKARYFQTDPTVWGHGESGDKVGIKCGTCKMKVSLEDYTNNLVEERKEAALARWNKRFFDV